MLDNCLLKMSNITKIYTGVVALDNVSMEFNAGEVHALVGENGAGKSTLIKIISGAITPEQGTIWFDNREFSQMEPSLAKELGIEVIYQEFNLVPTLSVAENIYLGNSIRKGILIDKKKMAENVNAIFNRFNVKIDPNKPVNKLSVAYMQLVEIAKAISKRVKVLIMDEPTAPLTNVETEILFELIKHLKESGVLIIYVSHRMEEIFQISDRVTVMRDGKKIITLNTKETNRKELIKYMVGRELTESYPPRNHELGKTILEVDNISGNGVSNISFSVNQGEILGLAGLVGSGRTELVRLIFGAERIQSGEIRLNGEKIMINSPSDAIKYGIGLIPEDRKVQGVLLDFSIAWNITLPVIKKLSHLKIISKLKEQREVNKYVKELSIKAPSSEQKVLNLSGGNQQKVVLSKWLATESKILIFDEPTRGIDVGTKQEIYKLMNRLTEQGMTIIMISSEMEELLGMADRLVILAEGEIAGTLQKSEFQQSKVLDLASSN